MGLDRPNALRSQHIQTRKQVQNEMWHSTAAAWGEWVDKQAFSCFCCRAGGRDSLSTRPRSCWAATGQLLRRCGRGWRRKARPT